jgi:cation:H+ antiporter
MKSHLRFRLFSPFALAFALILPALTHFFWHWPASSLVEALLYGVAIVAAAFVLGWVGEAAEIDLSGGLTVGLLALITILPEYVVSVYFAFAAGTNPEMAQYASANLTGANRLLLGLGWPLMALFGYLATRRLQPKLKGSRREFGIRLESDARIDLAFLAVASVFALLIPLSGQIHLLVGLVLLLLFIGYLWRQSRNEREEPELHGVAALVGGLPKVYRRIFIVVAVLIAAAVILMSAEPFAHGLVETGREFGVDDFLLIQWLAPIASEAPEFILAAFFAWRGRPGVGLAILLSSKVNQWTLLTASLPIGFIVGGGDGAALLLDARQVEEFALTSAQTLMGVGLLLGLRLGFRGALLLFVLFISTFVFPTTDARWFIAAAYALVSIGLFIWHRRQVVDTLKTPFR